MNNEFITIETWDGMQSASKRDKLGSASVRLAEIEQVICDVKSHDGPYFVVLRKGGWHTINETDYNRIREALSLA